MFLKVEQAVHSMYAKKNRFLSIFGGFCSGKKIWCSLVLSYWRLEIAFDVNKLRYYLQGNLIYFDSLSFEQEIWLNRQ